VDNTDAGSIGTLACAPVTVTAGALALAVAIGGSKL